MSSASYIIVFLISRIPTDEVMVNLHVYGTESGEARQIPIPTSVPIRWKKFKEDISSSCSSMSPAEFYRIESELTRHGTASSRFNCALSKITDAVIKATPPA
jgi:hypothetical protein